MDWVQNYKLEEGNNEMRLLLDSINNSSEKVLDYLGRPSKFDAFLGSFYKKNNFQFKKAKWHMHDGNTGEAIFILEHLHKKLDKEDPLWKSVAERLAIAYLRKGEQENCLANHGNKSCILPIKGNGVYELQHQTRKAISIYSKLLEKDPRNWENKWLLNIAYQSIGLYPDSVPTKWLITSPRLNNLKPSDDFINIAPLLGVDDISLAGGALIEDFNNDGLLDFMVSGSYRTPLRVYLNQGENGFKEITESAGLKGMIGGFNLYQLDFNNDGFMDVFTVRGAWKGSAGRMPNSLYKNNGNNTFTDVTLSAGLLSFTPNLTAVCADFNNDGRTDIFLGCESGENSKKTSTLYLNKGNGSFEDNTKKANLNIASVVRGLSAGDYDNDGLTDLFISNYRGENQLMKNTGISNDGIPTFMNVLDQAKLDNHHSSFASWFWDYNNDGQLDLYVSDYSPLNSTDSIAMTYAGIEVKTNFPSFYHNNGDGTFTNKSEEVGLNLSFCAMGANFEDFNNDGYLDFYLGTGTPSYTSIYPNRLFKNVQGKRFKEVSTEKGVAHIQKGHGIAFGDFDNDGDQEILSQMGGILPGDPFQNALFLNPSNNSSNWITIKLQGETSSKDAIGAKIKLVLKTNSIKKHIYRTVSSGGSFGSNSLQQEIGLGQNITIDSLYIFWPVTAKTQIFANLAVNKKYYITEGSDSVKVDTLKPFNFNLMNDRKHTHH